MESVILVYSVRHRVFGSELAKRVKALGWKITPEEPAVVLLIADAQSWESEGIRASYEEWRRQLEASRVMVIWVSSWVALPAVLPPGGGMNAWKGGSLSAPEMDALRQFLENCSVRLARKKREITTAAAPPRQVLLPSPPPPAAAAAPAPQPARPQGVGAAEPVMPAPVWLGSDTPTPRTAPPPMPMPEAIPASASEATGPVSLPDAPEAVSLDDAFVPQRREVRTSVFCPETLAKGRWFTLQVWLHFPQQSDEVRQLALESGHGERAGQKAGLRMASGALVGFSLIPEVLHTKRGLFGQRQPVHRYAQWNEQATNVEFPVCCPKSFREAVLHETIEISVEGIPIGSCTVELAFDRSGEMKTQFAAIRTAFASYSSQDREQVIGRLQMLAATVGVEPFFDVDSLRIGEDWEQRLMREVPTKDRFLLFWSPNASKSQWVEREWRLALRERGLEYILPVPLQPASPPKELSRLQFNDRYARMADYERLKRNAET